MQTNGPEKYSRQSVAGEINWKAYIASSAHLENVKKFAAAIPSKTLLSLFHKKATSSTLGPFRLSSSLTPGVPPSLPIAHLHESVARLSVTLSATPILRLSLLDRLKPVVDSLPAEVPYGIEMILPLLQGVHARTSNRTMKHGKILTHC